MNKRELSKKLYLQSHIKDNAYNWHIWKRAFDLGWINNVDLKIELIEELELLISLNEDDFDRGKAKYILLDRIKELKIKL